jgi:hypothetical protein
VVNGLVDSAPISHKPKIDCAQRCEQSSFDSSFFLDLTNCGVFGALACLDVPFGERPQEATTAVSPPDEGRKGDRSGSIEH